MKVVGIFVIPSIFGFPRLFFGWIQVDELFSCMRVFFFVWRFFVAVASPVASEFAVVAVWLGPFDEYC